MRVKEAFKEVRTRNSILSTNEVTTRNTVVKINTREDIEGMVIIRDLASKITIFMAQDKYLS